MTQRDRRTPAQILGGISVPTAVEGRSSGVERVELEPLRPYERALESRICASAWRTDGVASFVDGSVPHLVTNCGASPSNAADVLLALAAARRERTIEGSTPASPIVAVEIGAGLGLFAREVVRHFVERTRAAGHDPRGSLVYWVTDASPRTLERWDAAAPYSGLETYVRAGRCEGHRPLEIATADGEVTRLERIDAFFANYALDSLPGAVVRRRDGRIEQLASRASFDTALASELYARADLSVDALRALAAEDSDASLARLLPALPLLEIEGGFVADDADTLPYVEDVLRDLPEGSRTLLNHGALACLDAVFGALADDGFALVQDFGPTAAELVPDFAFPNRFGPSIALPVHFPLLASHAASRGFATVGPEDSPERTIQPRLFVRDRNAPCAVVFAERFGDERSVSSERFASKAAEYIRTGRVDLAVEIYREGLAYAPDDWHLLAFAAQCLNQQLGRHADALELAERACELNPWFSPLVWNTLGNCLYSLGRRDEAEGAYERARDVQTDDPQTQLDLAWTATDRGDFDTALASIAAGLARDDGHFESALLEKQREILSLLDNRRLTDRARLERRNRSMGRAG